MRVAVCLTTPPDVYSGGRYSAFMLAEALCGKGHESYVIADRKPVFYDDLASMPHHDELRFWMTRDFRHDMPKGSFDVVVLIPGTGRPGFYTEVRRFAIERGAHLILFNFETPNWYNALSLAKRSPRQWDAWERASRRASLVLSISREGDRWAKDFYARVLPGTVFDFVYPCINVVAADVAPDRGRGKRILLFMRFTSSVHKGSDDLDELFCESMRGHTLVLILGKDDITPLRFKKLLEQAREFGVQIELRHKLSDVEKFEEIKRARLVLFPSLFEGYGYPPVEAMYCNTPCVAFDLPVLRETCGDHLNYAEHGNWDDLREKVAAVLGSEPEELDTRSVVEGKVSPAALGERLEDILVSLIETGPVSLKGRARQRRRLAALAFFRLDDPGLRYRLVRGQARKFAVRCVNKFFRPYRRLRKRRGVVVYAPRFSSADELTSHYYRACWYLPFVKGKCEDVRLFSSLAGPNDRLGLKPEYMSSGATRPSHIRVLRGGVHFLWSLLRADLVVYWQEKPNRLLIAILKHVFGVPTSYVATEDPSTREFGEYCGLLWKYLMSAEEQSSVLAANESRFRVLAEELHDSGLKASCVFGTGPSLERAEDFDFSDTLCIVCNSIVRDEKLLDHLQPKFVCAGDVVSHFGVSMYAQHFREDLVRALQQRDLYLFTTAQYGWLFLQHHPDLTDRVFLIEQTRVDPTIDLLESYETAQLDSTMNIHMLPLASTFSHKVWLLGCDGKDPNGEQEDFWAHASETQYHDLVSTSHQCHPTFDLLRRMSTYERYGRSVSSTFAEGERRGITYRSLHASHVPAIQQRALGPAEIRGLTSSEPPCRVAELTPRKPESE